MKDLVAVIKIIVMEKKDIYLSVLFGFLAGISAVGLFASSGYLISRAALIPPLYALTVLIAFLKLFGFVRALGRYAERYFSHRATFTMLSNIRVTFYEKLEPYAPRVFQKYRSGDLLSRIVGDVESLQNFFLRVYYPPVVLVIIFLSTILFTSFFSLAIAVVLLLGLILTGLLIPLLFAWTQRKVNRQVREARGELSTDATEFLYGFRDLKIYQQLDNKEKNLQQSSDLYIKEQEKEGAHMMFSHSMNTMFSLVISWLVLGIGSLLVSEGELNGLFLAMLVMISLTVFENATPMAVLPTHLEDSKRASKRLFSIVKEEAKEVEEKERLQLQENEAPAIEMNNVDYHYPGESRKALDQVTLSIPSGSKIAVVGPSGSGKSTLLQVFMKFVKPDHGDVRINGLPLRTVNQESVWKHSNVVLQENHFFYGTIEDNLRLAREDVNKEELENVLKDVELSSFSLEDFVYERGENLSGGEKQRLAIARALLKGKRLWLLDEPTSSIDALTEEKIYNHLFQEAADDTLILISHRLTGLENMDQIVVMEHGAVVEVGTYEQLMNKQGYFYQMKQIEQTVFG
ncbi:thiol reductant ABC exporter subunit CydC [Halobacillus sp. BBL2006]|uniref:thiol reductant ABC exporter subunit CydC n=1 Tax=Halobacillus sp. BBL2006 TaxID=1543706 RepID=UPI000543EEA9|nr:thiol reductant ABC exporter subunit CydC [Halobacillus sp. BBL2006]KHE72601.1 ABC transporter ATP-binding protein [Halobacillus sp. BBL2006]